MSFTSLYTLVSFYHRHLNELMLLHQEALLLQRTGLAADYLVLFAQMITSHIAFENESLLPLLDECTDARWPAMLYEKEHEKVLAMLKKMSNRLQDLSGMDGREGRRAIIELLDYERSFKNVMEHHEEREEMALLKELDQFLSSAQSQSLIEKIQGVWSAIYAAQQQKMEQLHDRLNVEI